MIQLFMRAKFELDRLPEIQKVVIEDCEKGKQLKYNNEFHAHRIAGRLACIEGRLYLEAKQRGQKPPIHIAELAQKEFVGIENRRKN